MEVILPAHIAARFAGLDSMRKAGYVLRSARVLAALGYSVEVVAPERDLSARGTSDDKLLSGDVVRKGVTLSARKRQVDVIIPRKANMLATQEAIQLAEMADTWQPHPTGADQTIALVRGVEPMWTECEVPLNACVIRF